MPAVRFQSANSNVFGAPGVYVQEIAPSAPVRGLLRNTIGIVGECVRGPIGRAVEVNSYQRFRAVFGGRDKGAGGAILGHIWRFLQSKRVGRMVVVRAAAAAAVAASFDWETAAGGAGTAVLRIAAANAGTWGNDVQFKVSAASNGVSTSFNLTIRYLGSDTLYENLSINSTDDNLALTLGNDDANLVVLTKLASGRPVNTAAGVDGADSAAFVNLGEFVAAFTSVAGTDGVIADTDFTGTGKGMEIINAYKGVGICMVAGRSNTAVKTKILALAAVANERVWLACPDAAATTAATALTEAATLGDDRICYVFNHAYIIDPDTGEEIVDEPHGWMASILSQTEPDVHPGDVDNAELTKGITRLHNELSDADRDSFDVSSGGSTGRITYLQRDLDPDGNVVWLFGNAITTDLSSNNKQLAGRRMKDFLITGLAQRARGDEKKTNMKTRREARKGAFEAWLTELARAERFIAVDDTSNEPLIEVKNGVEVNTQDDWDSNIQRDLVRAKLLGFNLYMQLRVEVGQDVKITEV